MMKGGDLTYLNKEPLLIFALVAEPGFILSPLEAIDVPRFGVVLVVKVGLLEALPLLIWKPSVAELVFQRVIGRT